MAQSGTAAEILIIVKLLKEEIALMKASIGSIELQLKGLATGPSTDSGGIQLTELAAQLDEIKLLINQQAAAIGGAKKAIKAASEEKPAEGGATTAPTTAPKAKPGTTKIQYWNKMFKEDAVFKAKFYTADIAAKTGNKSAGGAVLEAFKSFPALLKEFEDSYAASTDAPVAKPEQEKDVL